MDRTVIVDISTDEVKAPRPTRTFNLTPELCQYIDTLPNRSAWLRDLLETVVIKKETLVTESQVVRLIEKYAGIGGLLQQSPSANRLQSFTATPQADNMGILDEINAILGVGHNNEI